MACDDTKTLGFNFLDRLVHDDALPLLRPGPIEHHPRRRADLIYFRQNVLCLLTHVSVGVRFSDGFLCYVAAATTSLSGKGAGHENWHGKVL